MNDLLRKKLCELLTTHGRALLEDRVQLEAMLWLDAGYDTRGMFALTSALDQRVPEQLLALPPGPARQGLVERLSQQLATEAHLAEESARWAVDSWAQAVSSLPHSPPAAQPSPPPLPQPHGIPEGIPLEVPEPTGQIRPAPEPVLSPFPDEEDIPLVRPVRATEDWDVPPLSREVRDREPFRRAPSRFRKRSSYLGGAIAVTLAIGLVVGLIWAVNRVSVPRPADSSRVAPMPVGQQLLLLPGHDKGVASVAFSPNGHKALSGSFDATVKLWNLDTGQVLHTFHGHEGPVVSVVFSADGKCALTGSMDRTVKLWDLETKQELRTYGKHESGVTCVALSPDGKRFLAACGFEKIKHNLENKPNGQPWETVQWFRPPQLDSRVYLWDIQTGACLRHFDKHNDEVTSVVFTPDGKQALSGSFDKTVRLWEVETGKEVRCFSGHTGEVFGVAISPDGKRAVSCSGSLGPINNDPNPPVNPPLPGPGDFSVRLWDLTTGQEIRRFDGHTNAVLSVAFSPNGKRVVSASFDTSVRVWDVDTGFLTDVLYGHNYVVHAAAVSSDGQRILSGGWDRNLRLWRMPP
jgi:WD40 repeat protein